MSLNVSVPMCICRYSFVQTGTCKMYFIETGKADFGVLSERLSRKKAELLSNAKSCLVSSNGEPLNYNYILINSSEFIEMKSRTGAALLPDFNQNSARIRNQSMNNETILFIPGHNRNKAEQGECGGSGKHVLHTGWVLHQWLRPADTGET